MLTVIGLDIGTTTVSAVAVNAQNGEVLKAVTVPNDSVIACDDGYSRMQNVNRIKEIVFEMKDSLIKEYAPVTAIGVTGQMHGIVYLNADGNAVSPLYTWQDENGQRFCKDKTYAETLSEKTGYKLATGYGLVTHYVNGELGRVSPDAVTFCTIHDYIVCALTGRKEPLIHTSDAASFGCFSVSENRFDGAALKAMSIDETFLPQFTEKIEIAGYCDGIPVTVAIGDNQSSVIGSLASEDFALVNIGTGSQISVPTNKTSAPNGTELRPLFDRNNLSVGAPLCGGRSFALLKDFFSLFAKELQSTQNIYSVMDRISEQESECHTLKVDTRFCGTRANPDIRGGISNIGIDNFTPSMLTKGFLYGMAEELFNLYSDMTANTTKASGLVGSGNAIRKSGVLRRYLSELFGLPIKIPVHSEEAAFGAAVCGAYASGIYKSISDAQNAMIHYQI